MFHLMDLYLINRFIGSSDANISVWRFKEEFMEDHSNESLLEVLKTLDHHKAEVTSVSYDGINVISGDIQGYIKN